MLFYSFTAPELLCFQAPLSSAGGIQVKWDYRHTGGQNLTQVIIELRQEPLNTFRILPDTTGEGLLDTKSATALNLIAGYNYTFKITASNEKGTDTVLCPPVIHTIGNQ